MYIMYANASNDTPSYTQVSLYVVWRVHPPGAKNLLIISSSRPRKVQLSLKSKNHMSSQHTLKLPIYRVLKILLIN